MHDAQSHFEGTDAHLRFVWELAEVSYPGLVLEVGVDGWRVFLQVRGFEPDSVTGAAAPPEGRGGRKWLLSPHMTRSEVVATAFKAVLTYVEHEVREAFRYRGRAVFGPHINIDALHAAAGTLDGRKDTTTTTGGEDA